MLGGHQRRTVARVDVGHQPSLDAAVVGPLLVLSVPAPTPEVSRRLGLRHQTVPRRARQMILLVRRWLPGVEMTVLGDQTYSVHELAGTCARRDVRLVAPLRMDAAL